MTLSNSHLAYAAEFDVLDRAMSEVRGVRLSFKSYSEAHSFRHRLHHARSIDRRRNMEVYQPGEELYGRSPYDSLTCRLREDPDNSRWLIYIEQNRPMPDVEPIGFDEVIPAQPRLRPPEVESVDFGPASPPPLMIGFRRRF